MEIAFIFSNQQCLCHLSSPEVLQGLLLFELSSVCTFLSASLTSTAQNENKYRHKTVLITFMHDFIWGLRSKLYMENWFTHKLTAHSRIFYKHFTVLKGHNWTNRVTTGYLREHSKLCSASVLLASFNSAFIFLGQEVGWGGRKCFSLSHVLLQFCQSSLITGEWESLWHRNWHRDPPHSPHSHVGDGNHFLKEGFF